MFKLLLLILCFAPTPVRAFDFIKFSPKSVNISALVGIKANIYGYTAPYTQVELRTNNAYALTTSNKFGYWQFLKIYLPPISNEICFFQTDSQNLTSPPTCIPTPPKNDFTSNIGPIVLPPTIAINTDKTTIPVYGTVATVPYSASGQSIPNTPINVHFFTQSNPKLFPVPAQAYSLPILQTLTNKDGSFTFSLPTSYSISYKFFATSNHDGLGPSPKSHTLNLYLPTPTISLWLISLLITIPIFFYLLTKSKKKTYLPALYPTSLVITVCPIDK